MHHLILPSRAAGGLAVGLSTSPTGRAGTGWGESEPSGCGRWPSVSSLSWLACRKLLPLLLGTVLTAALSWNGPRTVFCSSDLLGGSDLPAKHSSPRSHGLLLSCSRCSCGGLARHRGWQAWVQRGSRVTCSLSFKADSLNIRLMLSQCCAVGCNSICCDTVKVTPKKVCAAFWMSSLHLLHV